MSFSILDNFLPPDLVEWLDRSICDKMFPWYWRPSTIYGELTDADLNKDYQFVHIIYFNGKQESTIFPAVCEIIKGFELHTGMRVKGIDRIKANLLTPNTAADDELEDTIHIDLVDNGKKYMTMVYYVNDSDGDTVLYDSEKKMVKAYAPQKGTAFCFPSTEWHKATPPKHHKRRVVLNFVLEIGE